jgi:CheY-like chemotaxis protein
MDLDEQIRTANILIVDDNPTNVKLLEDILEQEDYVNVYSTTDPRQVRALNREWHFDLILLDLRMPHMDGFQVIDQLSEAITNDYLPVLILTAEADQETRLQALEKGAKDFITKPFEESEVLHRMRNMLEVRVLYKQQARIAQSLSRFFAPEVIDQLTAADSDLALGHGVARHAAILMLDLRGFTPLCATLSPDAQVALVIEYQSRMIPEIRRNNGTIVRSEGDGILVCFGAVAESATYAADALRAVDALMAEIASWRADREKRSVTPLEVIGSVTTGSLIAGIIGDETRLEFTILGDCVNEAAKLERHTKIEEVSFLATQAGYDKAIEQGYIPPSQRTSRHQRTVDGIDHPVDLVVLAS